VIPCEDDVIQKAAQGDQEAFRLLWEDHHAIAMALLCDSVIIVRSRKILLKELSCWRGGGCRDFKVGGPFVPG